MYDIRAETNDNCFAVVSLRKDIFLIATTAALLPATRKIVGRTTEEKRLRNFCFRFRSLAAYVKQTTKEAFRVEGIESLLR